MSEPLPELVRLAVSEDQVCEMCSALVMDMTTHVAWHAAGDQALVLDELLDRISILQRDVGELYDRVSGLGRDK